MPAQIIQLQEHACFRDLTEDQLVSINPLTSVETFSPGYILFKEGKPGDYLYLLTKGEIEVFYNIGEGGPALVDQIDTEEFFGCSVLIPPFTYTATTRSLTEIEVMKIDAKVLRNLMKENCQLGFAIQQQIIQMLLDRIVWFRLRF